MLECNVILTLFTQYICLHGYIHFIYLFNTNTKYRDMYRIPQTSQQIPRYEFLLILPSPTRNVHLVIFSSMRSLVSFFFKLNLCLLNLNIILILIIF